MMAESFDIFLTIAARPYSHDQFPVRISLPEGREWQAQLAYPALPAWQDPAIWRRDLEESFSTKIADLLGEFLFSGVFSPARQEIEQAASQFSLLRVFLETRTPKFFPLPWEGLMDISPFSYFNERQVIRYSTNLTDLALQPFNLPMEVLVAGLSDPSGLHFPTNLEAPLQHFSPLVALGLSRNDLLKLWKKPFEVVHLLGQGDWGSANQGVMKLSVAGEELDAATLQRLLKRQRTRLLILEACGGLHAPLLDLGHRILNRKGLAIIIVPQGENQASEEIYYGLAHDQPLDQIVRNIRKFLPKSLALHPLTLLHSREGQNLLRISRLETQLQAEVQDLHRWFQQINSRIEEERDLRQIYYLPLVFEAESDPSEDDEALLSDTAAKLKEVASRIENVQREYIYSHESKGMDIIALNYRLLGRLREDLEKLSRVGERVVNTWFIAADKELVARDASLVRGQRYEFKLQIGGRSPQSHVVDSRPLPEGMLTPLYTTEGLPLRVTLYSDDFVIDQPEQSLMLPVPPEESEVVSFEVTPNTNNSFGTLRACIYYQQNLLQSLRISASITDEPEKGLTLGNQAEVDFALSEGMRQLEHFPLRTLNILTNDNQDGTHTFAIKGSSISTHLTLTEGEMRTQVDLARKTLQEICSGPGTGKYYRFDRDNRGKERNLVDDLKALAPVGYNLFVDLITQQDPQFADELRQELGHQATIQVAATQSAKYVFPWALVYDKPLVRSNKNVVCPQFLRILQQAGLPGFLAGQTCSNCPEASNNNVICPFGFWGFKHVLEQPLSTRQYKDQKRSLYHTALGWEIEVHNQPASFLIALNKRLSRGQSHSQEIGNLQGVKAEVYQSKPDIGLALMRPDFFHVVYFFCHGGRSASGAYLKVGDDEQLFSTDLMGWQVRWPQVHPLVFINGCETVDLKPDDLVPFTKVLAYCRASGVIGTEIEVPDVLAIHFARSFFEEFLAGQKVGEIMRRQRLLLLERYNPLGLAYTPYCSAELRLIH
jgi:hypothetical protein